MLVVAVSSGVLRTCVSTSPPLRLSVVLAPVKLRFLPSDVPFVGPILMVAPVPMAARVLNKPVDWILRSCAPTAPESTTILETRPGTATAEIDEPPVVTPLSCPSTKLLVLIWMSPPSFIRMLRPLGTITEPPVPGASNITLPASLVGLILRLLSRVRLKVGAAAKRITVLPAPVVETVPSPVTNRLSGLVTSMRPLGLLVVTRPLSSNI